VMKKIRENALAFTVLGGLVAMTFTAWFSIEAKITKETSQLTPLAQHQTLEAQVEKAGINVEELRLQGDLRFFQAQYRRQCRTPQQKNSQNCQWLASEIELIKSKLQSVRPR